MSVSTSGMDPEEREAALDMLTLLLEKTALGVIRSEDFAEEFHTLRMQLQKDTEGDIRIIARNAAEMSFDRLVDMGILDNPDGIPIEEKRQVLAGALQDAYERMVEADDTEPEEH